MRKILQTIKSIDLRPPRRGTRQDKTFCVVRPPSISAYDSYARTQEADDRRIEASTWVKHTTPHRMRAHAQVDLKMGQLQAYCIRRAHGALQQRKPKFAPWSSRSTHNYTGHTHSQAPRPATAYWYYPLRSDQYHYWLWQHQKLVDDEVD